MVKDIKCHEEFGILLLNAIYIVYKIRKCDHPCQKDRRNVVCVVYDTTSSKSSLGVNHGKVCDFACRLPIKPSMLNLFHIVVHFNDASSFNGYIVEMVNYYKTISSISSISSAQMTYLSEREEFFHIEMTMRTDTALDQLNQIIDATFSRVEKFEPFDQYTVTIIVISLDHRLQDGLTAQHKFDHT